MMKLTEIAEMWATDAKIDKLELGDAAGSIDELHAKYVVHLAHAKLALRSADVAYYKMRKLRYRYYRGEMSKEELEQLQWDQYRLNTPLKTEMEDILICDDHIIKLQDKKEYLTVTVSTLESIIKALHNRTWNVKNAITWTQYTNGMI